jgi:hypothetical protein
MSNREAAYIANNNDASVGTDSAGTRYPSAYCFDQQHTCFQSPSHQVNAVSAGIESRVEAKAALPQVFYSSALRKHLRVVKAKDFSPMLSVWSLHSQHIGRLAPAARCVGEAVKQQLQLRRSSVA